MAATSQECRKCKPSYTRTDEHRAKISQATSGKPKPHLKGKKRPEVGRKIQAWWTQDRREEKRVEMLRRNPEARYHGLSAKAAKKLRETVGRCERCDHDGSESRLSVHHRDRNKRNQAPTNLVVLCWRCHMRDHAERGEIGRTPYPGKRRTTLN